MPFAYHRGQKIHYTVEGAGPLVVLQHGLLWDGGSWKRGGFVEALRGEFRVACVDSLGHGLSDAPTDPELYGQAQRAGDIVAVIDDLGADRAHLVGYSMGGWLAVGVAKYAPERLSSLVVGGWDIVAGLLMTPQGRLTFDLLMSFVRRIAPAEADAVTPETEPGLRACFDALTDVDGAQEVILGAGVPVMVWAGRDDPCHAAMQAFAEANRLAFLSTSGGHAEAMLQPGDETMEGLRSFLTAPPAPCPGAGSGHEDPGRETGAAGSRP